MKEIRAYIRRYDVDDVIEELRAAGAPGVAVIETHPVGYGYEPNAFERHVARLVQQYRYLAVVKLEIICRDAQVEPLIRVIRPGVVQVNPATASSSCRTSRMRFASPTARAGTRRWSASRDRLP